MTYSHIEKAKGKTYFVGEINGYKCRNLNELCKELKYAFNWPENELCIEAMYHLDWIQEKYYKIIVNKFQIIKNDKQKELLMSELDSYRKHWNKDNERFIIEYR